LDEWIVKDSPQSEQAAEAGFGELQYLNEGPVKGRRALYRNYARKGGFFNKIMAVRPSVAAFAQICRSVYFAKARYR
jgi:hypothetical protein